MAKALFGGVWPLKGKVRHWTNISRQINAALKAMGYDPKKRRNKDIALLFDLARWGAGKPLPKKAMGHLLDDGELFELLHRHGEVPPRCFGFCDLTPAQLAALEKRMWHRWADVAQVISAIEAPQKRLDASNDVRRKPRPGIQNPHTPLLSATLAQFKS